MEILQYLIDFFTNYGYFAVFFVLIACGFGLPIPEDIALVAGGVICALSESTPHKLDPHIMVLVSLCGVLLGDGVMFFLGRILGVKVTRLPGLKRIITIETYAKIQEKARKYGNKVLFIARFLPGLRAPIFVTAGVSHRVPYWKFLLMDGSAAVFSVPLWIYLGYFFAYDLDKILHWVRGSEYLIIGILGIIILIFFLIRFFKKSQNS
ncbi:MAG TPA: DedA family protein [Burkholderiales bacterium]|nr:DedA family protein [Burkholderiales bacterium]